MMFCSLFLSAQNIVVQGIVTENDEFQTPIVGATIENLASENEQATVSGFDGRFELFVGGETNLLLSVRHVGYQSKIVQLQSPDPNFIVIRLLVDTTYLDEYVLQRYQDSFISLENKTSAVRLSDLPTDRMPRLAGEPDLIKIVQNLPGVKTDADFSSAFKVRGGSDDQNLILLEDVPIFNPWHLFGLFSAFNLEALARMDFSKGVFPARYGTRLSSVLDISLQDGAHRNGAGQLTVSPISFSGSYGKALNQNTSFLVSMRRTYLDPVLFLFDFGRSAVAAEDTDNRLRYRFSDLNLKGVHRFNKNLQITLGLYRSADLLRNRQITTYAIPEGNTTENLLQYGWQNTAIYSKLEYRKPSATTDVTIYSSLYGVRNELGSFSRNSSDNSSRSSNNLVEGFAITRDFDRNVFEQDFDSHGLKLRQSFYLNQSLILSGGIDYSYNRFSDSNSNSRNIYGFASIPTFTGPVEDSLIYSSLSASDQQISTSVLSAFGSLDFQVGKFRFFPGLRLQYYSLGDYFDVMPRINMELSVSDRMTLTAGYGTFAQYNQNVGIELFALPTERWFWANENRHPLTGETITSGILYSLPAKWGTVSAELYLKTSKNNLMYSPREQALLIENEFFPSFSDQLLVGVGRAHGMEFFWQKNEGRIKGWFGYTLSWSERNFSLINSGEYFPDRGDRRHDIQTFWSTALGQDWDLGMVFNFKSGQPITLNQGSYLAVNDPLDVGHNGGSDLIYMDVNNYRLPAYHRLDLNVTWLHRTFIDRNLEIALNIINVYNRENVLSAALISTLVEAPNGDLTVQSRWSRSQQLPILPLLSFRLDIVRKEKAL